MRGYKFISRILFFNQIEVSSFIYSTYPPTLSEQLSNAGVHGISSHKVYQSLHNHLCNW